MHQRGPTPPPLSRARFPSNRVVPRGNKTLRVSPRTAPPSVAASFAVRLVSIKWRVVADVERAPPAPAFALLPLKRDATIVAVVSGEVTKAPPPPVPCAAFERNAVLGISSLSVGPAHNCAARLLCRVVIEQRIFERDILDGRAHLHKHKLQVVRDQRRCRTWCSCGSATEGMNSMREPPHRLAQNFVQTLYS